MSSCTIPEGAGLLPNGMIAGKLSATSAEEHQPELSYIGKSRVHVAYGWFRVQMQPSCSLCKSWLQEIAPFLRVLGCYPMELVKGEPRESSAEERQSSSNSARASRGTTLVEDSLVFPAAGILRRMADQVLILF